MYFWNVCDYISNEHYTAIWRYELYLLVVKNRGETPLEDKIHIFLSLF